MRLVSLEWVECWEGMRLNRSVRISSSLMYQRRGVKLTSPNTGWLELRFAHMHTHRHTYTGKHMCIWMCIYICTYVYKFTNLYVHLRMYVHSYIRTYVHMHVMVIIQATWVLSLMCTVRTHNAWRQVQTYVSGKAGVPMLQLICYISVVLHTIFISRFDCGLQYMY